MKEIVEMKAGVEKHREALEKLATLLDELDAYIYYAPYEETTCLQIGNAMDTLNNFDFDDTLCASTLQDLLNS